MKSNSSTNPVTFKIPAKFCCPISQLIMMQPVTASDGHVYEKEQIEQILKASSKPLSPITREPLDKTYPLKINHYVKSDISDFIEENKDKLSDDNVYLPIQWKSELKEVLLKKDVTNFILWIKKDKRLCTTELDGQKNALQLVCEKSSSAILQELILLLTAERVKKEIFGNFANTANFKLNPLYLAFNNSDKGCFKVLLQNLNIDEQVIQVFNVHFLQACKEGDLERVKFFLALGADINATTAEGNTALHHSITSNQVTVIDFLLAQGIETNKNNCKGQSPLTLAYESNDLALVKKLISRNAIIERFNGTEHDLLFHSILDNRIELAAILLLQTAGLVNVNAYNKAKETILMILIQKSQVGLIEHLLKHHKINIHSVDANGNTALHHAVAVGNNEIAGLLIARGGSIKARNLENKTPCELAELQGNGELSQWLRTEHQKIKFAPLLRPLQLKIKSQEEEIRQLHSILMETRKMLDEKTIQQEKKLEIEIEQIKATVEKKEKDQEKKLIGFFRTKPITPEQQRIQNELIQIISHGDIKSLKEFMESRNQKALLTEPDSMGTYPLVAAVYSGRPDMVYYIDNELQDKADTDIFWTKVDLQKVEEVMNTVTPSNVQNRHGSGYCIYDLIDWFYVNNRSNSGFNDKVHKWWFQYYDQEMLDKSLILIQKSYKYGNCPTKIDWCISFDIDGDWSSSKAKHLQKTFYNNRVDHNQYNQNWENRTDKWDDVNFRLDNGFPDRSNSRIILNYPRKETHDAFVKRIQDELKALKIYINRRVAQSKIRLTPS